MTGHVRRRGKGSWEIKFDVGRDPLTGRRRIRYHSFKGTKRQADLELARLVTADASGSSVDPSKVTVAEFLDRWERDWAKGNVSPKTLERYSEILRKHVRPNIGATALQKLRPAALADLYGRLHREGGRKVKGEARPLNPRTVGHIHRVLHRALSHAAQWGLVLQNVADVVDPPRVTTGEVQILRDEQVGELLKKLRGSPVYDVAALGVATGMRRGEMLALRWRDVDFDRALLRVEQSLEATKAGLRFKPPKTKHGRRTITLPGAIVTMLRAKWAQQQEQRLALGLGRAPDEALVFSDVEGAPVHPDSVSSAWIRAMRSLKRTGITLHALRHTHASQLIAAGVDVMTVSRRLGHGSPVITLAVYGHLFSSSDDRAASIMEATFAASRD
jgi:integrase